MENSREILQSKFSIVRLEDADVRSKTDRIKDLEGLVLEHEPMYPDISRWLKGKVKEGIRTGERVAFVGYLDEKPVVSSVVKRGEIAKFCHLHLNPKIRDAHLGEVFFALMAQEVRDLARSVYFTLPESVWHAQGEFFRSFNFLNMKRSGAQYRLFEEELECEAAFNDVWSAVAQKLPKICSVYAWSESSLASDLLMSIHPRYVEQIFSGKKRYELRRKFSTKWVGHRMNIYATEPAMQLVGHATVKRIIWNSPDNIWQRLGPDLGCSLEEFQNYTKECKELFAIELGEPTPFRMPISKKEISEILKESLVSPQSYCSVKPNKSWGKAVSIATFLQGAFGGYVSSSLNKFLMPPQSSLSNGSNVVGFQLGRLLS